MISFRALVFALAALLIINYVSAIGYGDCPPKHKVTDNKHKCFSDADCQKYQQICCPNQFNTKACTNRAPWMSRDDGRNKKDKYNGGGRAGVYQPYRY